MRKISLLLALLLCVTPFIVGCNKDKDGVQIKNDQMKIICDNAKQWLVPTEDANALYGYCITDMDADGFYELVTACKGNSGTVNEYYEVNEDYSGITKLEKTSQKNWEGGFIMEAAHTYTDTETGTVHYLYNDTIAETGSTYKMAVTLKENKIEEKLLASKIQNEDGTYTCYLEGGAEVSEGVYDTIVQSMYGNYEDTGDAFQWKSLFAEDNKALANDATKLEAMIRDSYEKGILLAV